MHLIWKTAEAEGEYWAFIHVEGLCNFRPVPVDDWPSVLRPLQEHFNIEPWVLYENLPRLLTIEVVWEVIISELLWKGLKTRMCINIFSILEMGQRNKKRQGIIVSTILYSEFLDLIDIHGQLISPYAKRVEQWVKTSDSRTYMCKTKLLKT